MPQKDFEDLTNSINSLQAGGSFPEAFAKQESALDLYVFDFVKHIDSTEPTFPPEIFDAAAKNPNSMDRALDSFEHLEFESMTPGDDLNLNLDISASFFGKGFDVGGGIGVSRNEDDFVLSVSEEFKFTKTSTKKSPANLKPGETPILQGPNTKGKAGVGAKVEFSFGHAEELKNNIKAVKDEIKSNPIKWSLISANPLQFATETFSSSKVRNKVSAIELSAEASAQISGKLNLELPQVNLAGQGLLEAEASTAVRIEYTDKGTDLVLQQTVSGILEVDTAADIRLPKSIRLQLLKGADAKVTGSYTEEKRIPIDHMQGKSIKQIVNSLSKASLAAAQTLHHTKIDRQISFGSSTYGQTISNKKKGFAISPEKAQELKAANKGHIDILEFIKIYEKENSVDVQNYEIKSSERVLNYGKTGIVGRATHSLQVKDVR